MNIFIITFHSAHNYGAVLQAFALQKYLKTINTNGNVACVDYRPEFIESKTIHKRQTENVIKWIAHNALVYPSRIKRKIGFERFITNYISTVAVEESINDEDAILIAGSDQIWNKKITAGKLDEMYFFDNFRSPFKYSYAASIGSSQQQDVLEVGHRAKGLRYIGVRETDSLEVLRDFGWNNVILNVDPVFLLDVDDYNDLAKKPEMKKYIFVYTLETAVDEVRIKIKDAKKRFPEAKVITLGSFRNIYGSDIHLRAATPEEFLGLIKFAECIITNSFHVTAFSVMYEKPLIYIPLRNGRGGRITSLLEQVSYESDFDCYDKENLYHLINASKDYLIHIKEKLI